MATMWCLVDKYIVAVDRDQLTAGSRHPSDSEHSARSRHRRHFHWGTIESSSKVLELVLLLLEQCHHTRFWLLVSYDWWWWLYVVFDSRRRTLVNLGDRCRTGLAWRGCCCCCADWGRFVSLVGLTERDRR
jgi:hypothetical protein